jgi:hypothetical protein
VSSATAFLLSLLLSGAQVPDRLDTIAGHVTAAEDVTGVGEQLELVCRSATLVAHTDKDGRFRIGSVPREPCRLYLRRGSADDRRLVAELGLERPTNLSVSLPQDAPARARLAQTGGLTLTFDPVRTGGVDQGLRAGSSPLEATGTSHGWRLSRSATLGRGSSTQILNEVSSKTLPLFAGEWAWTGVATRTFGPRSTLTFSGGVAHYDAPPTLLSRGVVNAMPFARVVSPLSRGHPVTIWEARARLDHRLLGERRQLGLFVEGVISSPLGTFRETGLEGRIAGAASTGRAMTGGLTFSF